MTRQFAKSQMEVLRRKPGKKVNRQNSAVTVTPESNDFRDSSRYKKRREAARKAQEREDARREAKRLEDAQRLAEKRRVDKSGYAPPKTAIAQDTSEGYLFTYTSGHHVRGHWKKSRPVARKIGTGQEVPGRLYEYSDPYPSDLEVSKWGPHHRKQFRGYREKYPYRVGEAYYAHKGEALPMAPVPQTPGHEIYYKATGPLPKSYSGVETPPAPSPWQADRARKTPIPSEFTGSAPQTQVSLHYYGKDFAPPKSELQAAEDWAKGLLGGYAKAQAGEYIKRGLPWPGAPAAPSVSGYNRVREAQQGFGRSGVSYSAEPKTYAYEATLQQPEGPKESGLERVVGGFFGTIGDTLFGSSRSHRRRKRRKSGPDTLF